MAQTQSGQQGDASEQGICPEAAEIASSMGRTNRLELLAGGGPWTTKPVPRSGVPGAILTDGPSGLRYQAPGSKGLNDSIPATCFPSPATCAATWDEALMTRIGEAVGEEARAAGVDVVLGPGVNIKRNPLGGRSFEYYSEDPLLAGRMGAAWIRGLQSTGTGACVKHFAANSQEYKRFSSDSVLDERTLHELYLRAFEIVVRESHPECLMSSYNLVNGTHSSDNAELLDQTLRHEWGFEGLVMSDWGGTHDRVTALKAGLDLAMPGPAPHHVSQLKAALRSGAIASSDVERAAGRVITLALRHAEHHDPSQPEQASFSSEEHDDLAREAAEQSCVLLANDGTLPLASGCRVALFGDMAQNPRYQGSGSSHVNATHLSSLLGASPRWDFARGCLEDGSTTDELVDEAATLARKAEVCVVCVGVPASLESEGFDREDLKLPAGQERMLAAVAAENPHTVVVLFSGSAVECPWADDVAAILWAGLPGQEGGEALYRILSGYVSPSGHLAESWPMGYADVPSSECFGKPHRTASYREGLYVGYRYYETADVAVRWPFGHGLAYTSFVMSDLEVTTDHVSVSVRNAGSDIGSCLVQVYAEPPTGGPYRPARVLVGWSKVPLAPYELARVTIPLDSEAFSIWTEEGWRIPGGTYHICVGHSAHDTDLTATLEVAGDAVTAEEWQVEGPGTWYAKPEGLPSQEAFEALMGRSVPEAAAPAPGTYSMESTLVELEGTSALASHIAGLVRRVAKGQAGDTHADAATVRMMEDSALDASLSSLINNSRGIFPEALARRLVQKANES
ncbi:MAG: glycoside hydrolase family 3 C-terminal domain-containing protein [Atopobiaceae bacterium]|nr:glycoside hydrolase family 3 C-terminal domain-containing protein [Atopobiaceae bacterium]MCH4180543.1 glycoside hydrolase family 3 C-terminal domain-containing protein [Atopobiaceae bacterium]MCH4214268.1 glycoside hydrolase family 3 C-terminal domain-containing protein [Atopobiaceae bacterium]MCH4229435.1 glycoside hydrolase family 3 C-terminal domain-containing protein [Atopobiaceae bacterium]MCH4276093.1 glycoside hydrolase family 3 C-terminal domain-containing protein [Atopobiaceae bact